MRPDDGVAVAELGRALRLGGDAGKPLDEVPAHLGRRADWCRHPISTTLSSASISSADSGNSGKSTRPFSKSTRSRIAAAIACGCSMISFSMKWG